MHGEPFKHLEARQPLKKEFEPVFLDLAEEQKIENAVKSGDCDGTETEYCCNKVNTDAEAAECGAGS